MYKGVFQNRQCKLFKGAGEIALKNEKMHVYITANGEVKDD